MDRPTKILIFAIAGGIATAGLGLSGSKYFEHELGNLVDTCNAEKRTPEPVAKNKGFDPKTTQMAETTAPSPPPGFVIDKNASGDFPDAADKSLTVGELLGRQDDAWTPPAKDLICEPKELSTLDPLTGIQKQIAETALNARNFLKYSLTLAGLIVLIGALPFTWYFFLRRVRELSEAIRAK